MDPFVEKQAQIIRHRTDVAAHYPGMWSRMISEWSQPGAEDRLWLTYSANYLFRTNNVRWAIDPLTLNWRVRTAPKVDVARDLQGLSFVLLTHRHSDHLDLDLLSALRHLPITWVVPDFFLYIVLQQAGLQRENIIIPSILQPIELNGIRITPFNGMHLETTPHETNKGVPSLGYLVEANGKRLLFPGDTRTYNARQFPDLGTVDHLIAHLWLGRESALMEEPPLTDAFCTFCLDLKPRRILLTHLDEFGRNAEDLWDEVHARKVVARLQAIAPDIPVESACMGESALL